MSEFKIRPATREDVPTVWTLILELADYERLLHAVTGTQEMLERFAFDDKVIDVFVGEVEGQIVGYTISYISFSTFRVLPGIWLEDLYVRPETRGSGYGKALLQNLIDICQARGYGRLEWSVLDWNEPAIEFYKAMGANVITNWHLCRMTFDQ